MLRPIIISSPDPKGTGGQSRNYYVLKELVRKGYVKDPLLIIDEATPQSIAKELENLGYAVMQLREFYPIPESYMANALLRARMLRNEGANYDLVVSQSEHYKYVCTSYIIHKLLNIPWTAILQSFLWLNPFRYGISMQTIMRTLTTINILNKTLVHVVSESIPQVLGSIGLNLRSYSLLDVPVGIDREIINEVIREGYANRAYDIAYMARISEGKGVLDLIYVVYKLKHKGINPRVLILGEFQNKELKDKFIMYTKALGIYENFIFAGFITGKRKYELLRQSKLFLYPSKIDAFSVSLIEALSLGLPTITLNAPFTKQFAGIIMIANSLEEMVKLSYELLNNEDLRLSISKKSMDFAGKFTHENAALSEYKAYMKTLRWYVENAVKTK